MRNNTVKIIAYRNEDKKRCEFMLLQDKDNLYILPDSEVSDDLISGIEKVFHLNDVQLIVKDIIQYHNNDTYFTYILAKCTNPEYTPSGDKVAWLLYVPARNLLEQSSDYEADLLTDAFLSILVQ
jgi:hypothetical protein